MLLAALLPALLAPAFAGTTLRNDTSTDDSFSPDNSQVAWLAYPECAISVLKADAADLPLEIDTVQFLLGSNTGDQDGENTLAEVGIQVTNGEGTPSLSTPFAWGPQEIAATVTSSAFNTVTLHDVDAGTDNVTMTDVALIVWVCAPDDTSGYVWPYSSANNTSGLFIHNDSPDEGNWLDLSTGVQTLASAGAHGSWVIRASSGGGDSDADTDSDSDSDADSDADTDTASGDISVYEITPASTDVGMPVNFVALGSGFVDGAEVTIGGLAASNVVVQDDGTVSGKTPSALTAGVHDLVVRNVDGSSATLSGAFTVTGGCGCTTSSGIPMAWLLPLGLGLVLLRRR